MIAFLEGEVVDLAASRVVINVAGVGYEVLAPTSVLENLHMGQTTKLITYHHIRENSQDLYGFDTDQAKRLFELLLTVASIGPKSALAVMSLGAQDQIRQAITTENVAFIAAASGVGKKSAERICIELKDKLGIVGGYEAEAAIDDDAQSALLALGYSAAQAAQALSKIDSNLKAEDRVKLALKEL